MQFTLKRQLEYLNTEFKLPSNIFHPSSVSDKSRKMMFFAIEVFVLFYLHLHSINFLMPLALQFNIV